MQRLNPKDFTDAEFILQRANESYYAAVCLPDVFYAFSTTSQVLGAKEKNFKVFN